MESLQESWFQMHLRNCFQTKHSARLQTFSRETESGRSMGGWKLKNIPPIKVPKGYAGKIYVV